MNNKLKTMSYIVMLFFIAISGVASANSIIDQQQDVIKTIDDNGTITTEKNQMKGTVDISKINVHEKDNESIDLTMVLFDEIVNNSDTHYIIWYNTTNAVYYVDYTNGENVGWVSNTDFSSGTPPRFSALSTVVTNGNIITATYEKFGSIDNPTDYWGYSITVENETMIYEDYVPNSRFDASSDDNDQNNADSNQDTVNTPGFTIVIFALTIIFLLIVRKKQNQ